MLGFSLKGVWLPVFRFKIVVQIVNSSGVELFATVMKQTEEVSLLIFTHTDTVRDDRPSNVEAGSYIVLKLALSGKFIALLAVE